MIYIKKGREPAKLQQYKRKKAASFDAMDTDVKSEVRQALLKEQGHLCAYCMRKIDATDIKIEHYQARNSDNELQYSNLLAVCKGNEGQRYELQTCDTHKKNTPIKINPLNEQHMQTIYYTNNGEIHSENMDFEKDLTEILNLNNPKGSLLNARSTALKALQREIEKDLRGKTNSMAKLRYFERLWEYYHEHQDVMTEYVGILRWYIDKKLNKLNK